MSGGDEARDQALELLRSQHTFPGEFAFRVVIRPGNRTRVVTAMVAATGDENAMVDVGERVSRKGSYVALHVRLRVQSAEVVLDVYDMVMGLEGILTVM